MAEFVDSNGELIIDQLYPNKLAAIHSVLSLKGIIDLSDVELVMALDKRGITADDMEDYYEGRERLF